MAETTTLRIPIDATALDAIDDDHRSVRVVARDARGALHATRVELDDDRKAEAEIEVPRDLGDVQISFGPGDIATEDLPRLRLPQTRVRLQDLVDEQVLRVPDLTIDPGLWRRWRRWCRTFTVRGQVTCPNGSPLPNARVTAFDVDFWWWWSSWQQVGDATTDANGEFEITFRWCCGFEPWWWWHRRHWRLDALLADALTAELELDVELPRPGPQPDPRVFSKLVDVDGLERLEPLFGSKRRFQPPLRALAGDDAIRPIALDPPPQLSLKPLESLRVDLARTVPQPRIAERLRLWPWFPWHPWRDCNPDLVFQVHASCPEPETLVLNETLFDVRWNVPTTLEDVQLVVQDDDCCLAPGDPAPAGNCVVLSNVCSVDIEAIGGNEIPPTATPAQAGYAYFTPRPGNAVDRPFAEVVHVSGTFGTLAGVDVYTFQFRPHAGGAWADLPPGAMRGFSRRFYGPPLGAPPATPHDYYWAGFPVQTISGREVYETREHFEQTHDPGTWGPGNPRLWLAANYFLLLNMQTQNFFADGTYDFRLVGFTLNGGALENERVLPLCGTQTPNGVVITFDNRFVGGASGHPNVPGHECGAGTVHLCTLEPDTDILAVRVGGVAVDPCAIVELGGGSMEIDFLAHDPEGHLADYDLRATYDDSKVISFNQLRNAPGATLVSLDAPARPVGPSYSAALGQGATAPSWTGGRYRLTLPDASSVFTKSCGYQLELKARKRTLVSCSGSLDSHRNQSHFTVTLLV